MKILRIDETLMLTGDTRSPLYSKVAAGLFPRPVKLGRRAAGWPEHEVEAVLVARAAGATDMELAKLVSKLHDNRKSRLTRVLLKLAAFAHAKPNAGQGEEA